MERSPADLITQNNYLANFGYTLPDEIPNSTFQNDNVACGQYSKYVDDYRERVLYIWFQDTGIEQAESYAPYNAGLINAVHPSPIANTQIVTISSSSTPGTITPASGAVIPSNLPGTWRVVVSGNNLQYYGESRDYRYIDGEHSVLYRVYSSGGSLRLSVTKGGLSAQLPGAYRVKVHPKRSLRAIAKDEYGMLENDLRYIDVTLKSFDRSRFSEDEFYPMANLMYHSPSSDQPISTAQTARLLHYHRNPHHLQSYTFDEPTGGSQAIQMYQPHVWIMIADWLANPNLNSDAPWSYAHSPNPFVYYYGSKYLYEAITYHDAPSEHPYNLNFTAHPHTVIIGDASFTYYTYTYTLQVWHDDFDYWKKQLRVPMISKNISINSTTDLYIQNIVKRWMPVDDGQMPHPNYAEYPHLERVKHELVINTSGDVS